MLDWVLVFLDWVQRSNGTVTLIAKIDGLVDNNKDLEDQEGKADKDETKDLATSVGNYETLVNIIGAFIGSSDVGVGSDSHTDVPGDDGGEATNEEGNSCVELSKFYFGTEGNKNCEKDEENTEEDIFLL